MQQLTTICCLLLLAGSSLRAQGPITSVEVFAATECGVDDGRLVINTDAAFDYQYGLYAANTLVTLWQSGSEFTDLAPGVYRVAVRQADQPNTLQMGYEYTVNAPDAPIISSVSFTDGHCMNNGGTITISLQSSAAAEFSIDGGQTYQTTNVFTQLPAGTYHVVARSLSGGCEVYYSTPITVESDLMTNLAITETHATDCSVADGTITIEVDGNSGMSFEYSIDGGVNWSSINSFSGLAVGTYQTAVRTSGFFYCSSDIRPVTISAPNLPQVANVTTTSVTDCDVANGRIEIEEIPGSNYEYRLNNGTWQSGTVFVGLSPSTYHAEARLSSGACKVSLGSYRIEAPATPHLLSISHTDATMDTRGTVSVQAAGNAAVEYGLLMPNGITIWQTGSTFSGLEPGSYQVAVRFADNGCANSYNTIIVVGGPAWGPIGGTGGPVIVGGGQDDPFITHEIPVTNNDAPTQGLVGLAGTDTHSAYPNPTRSSFALPTIENAQRVVLTDARGGQVAIYDYTVGNSYPSESLTAGTYTLRVLSTTGEVLHRQQLVKQ